MGRVVHPRAQVADLANDYHENFRLPSTLRRAAIAAGKLEGIPLSEVYRRGIVLYLRSIHTRVTPPPEEKQ